MHPILKIVLIVLTLAAAFACGWFVEFWNSPLASHICYESGKQLTIAVTKTWGYQSFWAVIFAACALPFLGELLP